MTAATTRETSAGRTLRIAAWAGLAVLVLASMILYSPAAGPRIPLLVADAPSLLAYAAAAAAAIVAASRAFGREQRFWSYLALASGLQLLAELTVDFQSLKGIPLAASVTASSIGGLLSLGMTAAVFGLLFSMSPLAERSGLDRARAGVDVAVMVALGLAAAVVIEAGPLLAPFGVPFEAQVLAASRLVVGLAVLGALAFNVFGFRGRQWHSWDRLVAVSLAISATGAVLWPAYYLGAVVYHSWIATALGTIVFAVGQYVAFMAAVYRLTTAGPTLDRPRLRPVDHTTAVREAIIVPVVLLAVIALAFVAGWTDSDSTLSTNVVLPIVAIATALVALRTALLRASGAQTAVTALVDAASGAYSPAVFGAFLQRQYEYARATAEPLALAEVDIDGFGAVNDRAGHLAGDDLLARVASSLAEHAPPGSTVFRTGADSFAITMPGIAGPRAQRAAHALGAAATVTDPPGPVSASVGVSWTGEGVRDAEGLRDAALEALDEARARGRGQVGVATGARAAGRGSRAREAGSFLAISHRLAEASEQRSEFTRGHGERVAATATALAERLGMDEGDVETMRLAGLLHDLGKISVPDRVIEKPSALSSAEEEIVREHPVLAARMVAPADMPDLMTWIADHHERWDGSGYPMRLEQDAISLGGRILGLADAWENLIVRQPTRRALSHREAVERIRQGAGTLWDPVLVEALPTDPFGK